MQSGGIVAGADDFLPIFIYVLSCVQLPHLHSTIEFINQYLNQQDKQGEPYYYFIQMTSAVAYFDSITLEGVKEKIEEKRKKREEEEKEKQRAAEEAAELERIKREEEERAQDERLTKIPPEVVVDIDSVLINSHGKSDAFIEDNPPPLISTGDVIPENYIKLLNSVKDSIPTCESKIYILFIINAFIFYIYFLIRNYYMGARRHC